jgi:hypothetical protein
MRFETFSGREKSQSVLARNDLLPAFQVYDQGSVPFARSNFFKHRRLIARNTNPPKIFVSFVPAHFIAANLRF